MAGKKWSKEAPMVWGRPMGGGGAKYVKIGEEMKHFFHIFFHIHGRRSRNFLHGSFLGNLQLNASTFSKEIRS